MDPIREAECALDSVRAALGQIDRGALQRLLDALDGAGGVFLCGAGRSGLMVRAFGMRLAQMGLRVHVVGETATPAIGPGDLLLACSASGRKETVLANARIACEAGGTVAAVTSDPSSPLARLARLTVVLPTAARGGPARGTSAAPPLGTLLEYTLLVLLDSIVRALMERRGVPEEEMRRRHANLE